MKKLDVVLGSCHGCYYLGKQGIIHNEHYCTFHSEHKLIYEGHHWENHHEIPEWCPLPNYNPFNDGEKIIVKSTEHLINKEVVKKPRRK